jgi:hypothetical protein
VRNYELAYIADPDLDEEGQPLEPGEMRRVRERAPAPEPGEELEEAVEEAKAGGEEAEGEEAEKVGPAGGEAEKVA